MSLEDYFPQLQSTGYTITSPATPVYNCIAWAAGMTDDWWWPDPMGVSAWPPAAPRAETVEAFLAAFESLGYVRCDDAALEPGFEKVALYALDGLPKHAARQLPNGRWTSKCGELEDIEHTLDGLAGPWYGSVVHLLKRPLPGGEPSGETPTA
jgi:hypothetical protein